MVRELERCGRVSRRIGDSVFLKDSPTVLVGRFGIGAPAAVAKCEELIACGVRRILALGTAASIHKEISIGDIIICDKAFSDEGTSQRYGQRRKVFRATKCLLEDVKQHLNAHGLPSIIRAAWTTDAPYWETRPRRDVFRGKGARVVEMEASALYMLAGYRNVEALSILVVGDSIAGRTWQPHFRGHQIRSRLKRAGMHLLRFVVR
jgi:purine-nucleoside phosphorylase